MEKDYKAVLMEKELERQNTNSDNYKFNKEDVKNVEFHEETIISHKRSTRHKLLHLMHKMHLIQKHESKNKNRIHIPTYVDSENISEKIDLAYIKEHRKI